MPFVFEPQEIPAVVLITPRAFADSRGYFVETYKRSEFQRAGIPSEFYQDNCSASKKGVVRGLHYQLDPAAQGKLLRALSGSVWEVAVDIRRGSPTFGRWTGAVLSAENRKMLWIPPGFAAGMVSLEDDSQLAYKTTEEYSQPHERGIRWSDPTINIRWPVDVSYAIVSDKDQAHPLLKDAEINFVCRPLDGPSHDR
ncbi:MAG: dTDP-4-dehydrorhamnose 3,5-epimerase [Thermoplasmata archaeon]